MKSDPENWTRTFGLGYTGFREEGEKDGPDAEMGCSHGSLEQIWTLRIVPRVEIAKTLEIGEC